MKNLEYDYSKLRSRIVEVFGSQKKFIEKINMSTPTFIYKIKTNSFDQSEILEIINVLNISKEEIILYFFSIKS